MITRSLTSPLTSVLTRPITSRGAGGGFTPNAAFFAGAKGLSLDLTATGINYQDSARTTLVSTTGQPIGSPTDLSGNNAHPLQATAGNRPTFNGGAVFDGTSDSWSLASLDLSGTAQVTIVVGQRSDTAAGDHMLLELSADVLSNAGSFYLTAPEAGKYQSIARGTATASGNQSAISATYVAPDTAVLSITHDIPGDLSAMRVNGVAQVPATGDKGAGNFGSYPLHIGARGGTSLYYTGLVRRLIVIGRLLTAPEIARAEAWCAEGSGLFF